MNSIKRKILWGLVSVFCFVFTGTSIAQQANWESTHGPLGGASVYSIHNTSEGTLYLGTYSSGVYTSDDQGQTWNQINDVGDVFDLLVTPSGRIILATDEIIYSDDGGDSWTYGSDFHGFVSLEQHNDLLAAGDNSGTVHFSSDNGTSWQSSNLFPNSDDSPFVWDLTILDDETIIAATSNGLFTTSLQDTVWNSTSIVESVRSLVVSDTDIFAATSFDGIKKSTDNGSTWNDVTSYPSESTEQFTITSNGDLYAANLDTMFYSTDNGITWEGVPLRGLPISDFRALDSDHNGTVIAGIYESGAYKYDPDNEIWDLIGPPSTHINDLHVTADGRILAGTDHSGLHIYDIASGIWSEGPKQFRTHYDNNGRSQFFNITFVGQVSSSEFYMGVNRGIYHSSDEGNTWTQQNSGYAVDSYADLTATSWNHSEPKGMFIGTQSAGIYHSKDGNYWTPVNNNLPGGNNFYSIYALQAGADGEVYAGGAWDGLKQWNSADSSWARVQTTGEVLNERVRSIAVHPDGSLFAGNSVLRSASTGWESLEIPSRYNYEVETIGISGDGSVFISTSREETFRSDDIGKNWTNITEGLPDIEIHDFVSSGEKLVAATAGLGVYQMENISTSISDDTSPVPSQIRLQANYPNPFNPSTTIQYSLPNTQQVTLKIYNTVGHEIATLVNQQQHAGTHTVTFEASNLSSGLYFYQIKGGNTQMIRKMMLLK